MKEHDFKLMFVLVILISLALFGLVVYVAAHFIGKYW